MNMTSEQTLMLLNTPMHKLTMQESLDFIQQRVEAKQFTQHSVVNVAKLVNIQKDTELKSSVDNCDLINIDGMGVVWAGRMLGHDIPERVSGVDLFLQLIALSEQEHYPVFLLGATAEIVATTASKLMLKHPALNIAGYHHGYFWNNEKAIVESVRASGARLLFVAITSPKKENFINQWQQQLGVDFVMGVGGTFDVVAGKVRRAPPWMQRAGLEWLFRVLQEPRRMWKRYLYTNSMFAWLILKELFHPRTRK